MKSKMTRRTWGKSVISAAITGAAVISLPGYGESVVSEKVPHSNPGKVKVASEASSVLITRKITSEALVKIYEALGRPATGKVAVKISTGEPGGHNFLQPSFIKDIVQKVNGTIVECNTAYGGRRSSTASHLQAAREHGFFDIADVDIMDADGSINIPVRDTTHIGSG